MQRRYFLRSLLFVTGGMVFTRPFARWIRARQVRTISGRIASKGRPLANVVVTDGFNVVTTDKDGRYAFDAHTDAQFVTISTPSGYEFLHTDHITRQYQPIDALNGGRADFNLEKLSVNDQQHRFIIWADPQVKNQEDVSKMMNESVPDLKRTVAAIPAGVPVHGICVGDIVWDTPELFPDYDKAIKDAAVPFFQAKGNHDMDYRLGGNETSAITFKKMYGPNYYSFNRGQVHYVVLDDVFYLGKEREYKGHITQEQLDWLEKDLSFVPKDHLLIICLHIPVHNGVDNRAALYSLLNPFSKCHIMSGHTHYNRNVITDGIFEHNHGTVCGAWWTGPICEDGTPDGYGVYEVKGTELSWHYQSTGKDKTHQLSLFIQKDEAGTGEEMVANVYNWDPAWKVEWWVDGNYKGMIANKPGFDPLAVATLKGPSLPVKRAFAEPKKTDHLFSAPLETGYKNVKVRATDRFGHVYEAQA